MQKITSKIHYVGVNDRNKNLFEGLWPLPNGVSYNSYLVTADKVCLIDTVEVDFFVAYIRNIQEVLGERPIDYLVINHISPSHSTPTSPSSHPADAVLQPAPTLKICCFLQILNYNVTKVNK